MLFINLTKLPKKAPILSYLTFSLSHLLSERRDFLLYHHKLNMFCYHHTIVTFSSHLLKKLFLKYLTYCQHKSKNLAKIIAVIISSQNGTI